MNGKTAQALKTLRDALQEEANEHCVAVHACFNCEGYTIDYRTRTPGSLKRAGISMRNLRGEFIKETI